MSHQSQFICCNDFLWQSNLCLTLTNESNRSCYIIKDCNPVDLLFAVDTSLSLENNTYHTADNINKILDRLLLDDDSFNVAVMSYDLNYTEQIKLGQYRKDEIKKAMKEIPFNTSSSPTFTGKAIRKGIEVNI